MKPVQVMIVEDEALVGIDIQDNLINYGYHVVGISDSGEAAIENARKSKPEVILMDIQLNGKISGIDAAKEIHQNLGIPIIYLTAYSDDKTLTKALEASPSGYLLKPFVPRELHTSIQSALKKDQSEKRIKLERLRYIQKNILEKKNLKRKLANLQEYNSNLPLKSKEKNLERIKYILNSIQKRKRIETDLREQIKKSEHLENLLGDLVFNQRIEKYFPYIFPLQEFTATLEYTKEEVTRMGNLIIPLLIHPEDFKAMETYFKDLIEKPGTISEIEIRLKHKSGIWRYFACKGIYEETEKDVGNILHYAKDITWLKNLQYTSHISREKFVAISNNPYFGIAVLDLDAKIMNLNPTLEHLTGYTKEDLNWLNFSDYIGLKELRSICQNFEKLKMGTIDTFQTETFIYTKHKGAFWGYMVFNPIYTPERVIDRIVCTLVDISESKLFEKKVDSKHKE
ncbi:MAG: response regulator [Leptospiraceae bacterium]|nr:response regulator [Leptospiraceae bacterium]